MPRSTKFFLGASGSVQVVLAGILSDLKTMAFPGHRNAKKKTAGDATTAGLKPKKSKKTAGDATTAGLKGSVPVDSGVPVDGGQAFDVGAGGEAAPPADGGMDLLCTSGPDAQLWFNMQQKMRFGLPAEAAFGQIASTAAEPVMFSILEDMNALRNPAEDTCGVGKLAVQLMNIITADETGGNIAGTVKNEKITSPILTLLLDVPWESHQPHWPLFGLYAQMAMRRIKQSENSEFTDGLMHPELQQYAQALNFSIMQGDLEALYELASAYLSAGTNAAQESPLAFLTALFTQAASSKDKQEARELFQVAQQVTKQMIHSPKDFDTTLTSKWPIWGMAYLASMNVV